jgi:gamma-butyrobetaine dioxygenase
MIAGEPALREALVAAGCVKFVWSDGCEAEFAAHWLLDNAGSSRGAVGAQRHRSAQSLQDAGALRRIAIDGDDVRLEFAADSIVWSAGRLRAWAQWREAAPAIRHWPDGAVMANRPAIGYADYLAGDDVLLAALSQLQSFGFVLLSDCGTEPDEVERAVARFGYIRETNYGRLFDVRVAADPDNLAFTAHALEPHTDNPYRDPVPTLQLLHGLESAGTGGATFFLDGFALAGWFRQAHAEHFALLSATAVPFAFLAADGAQHQALTPVIRCDADGEVTGLRFNHRALGALRGNAADAARWYESYLVFAAEAGAKRRRHSRVLAPGEIAIWDNERILHGRGAFPGTARRRLRGCYADRDGLRATLARLTRETPPPASAAGGL